MTPSKPQTPAASQESLDPREKRILYWPQIEEAVRAAGLRVETDESGRRIVRAECEKCSCMIDILRSGPFYFGSKQQTNMLRLSVTHWDWRTKPFPELKKGGFNYAKLVEFLKTELAEAHQRHLLREGHKANEASALDALLRAVTALALPDFWERDWKDNPTGKYGGGLARPKESGMVHLRFDVFPVEVETVLRFLKEQGILEREASR